MINCKQIKYNRQNITRCSIFNYQFSIINFLSILILLILSLITTPLFSQNNPYWKQTEGLYGGVITCITGDENFTFIGTLGAGVYKTSYWKESWEPTLKGLDDLDIRAIILTKNKTLLAGTYGSGIFKSTDYGESWSYANTGITAPDFGSFAEDSDGAVWAGSFYGGIFLSSNEGDSWQYSGLNDYYIWSIAVKNNGKIFVGTQSGIFYTTNKGYNWYPLPSGFSSNNVRTIVIISDTLYAGTDKGVFGSDDEGNTWFALNDSLTNTDVWSLLPYDYGQLFVGTRGDGVYFWSSIGGHTCWRKTGFMINNAWIRCLGFAGGGIIYAGTGGNGVFRTIIPASYWDNMSAGINNLDITSFAINKNGIIFAGTSTQGVFKSEIDNIYWLLTSQTLTNKDILSVTVDSNNYLYVGTYGNGIFISKDNGDSFTQINNGLVGLHIWALALNSKNRVIAGTGGSGIFRYEPDSSTWVPINNGLTYLAINNIIKTDNGFLYASTSGGGIYKSENDGDTWNSVNNGLGSTYINTVGIGANGDLIAGTDGAGAYLSIDDGENWSYIGLTGNDIRSIIYAPDGFSYIATFDEGIYRSKLDTLNWEKVNTGLITNSVHSLICDNKGRLFTSVYRNGVYLYDPATGVDEDIQKNENEILINPNPANDKIKIKINVPLNFGRTISIYNPIGELLKKVDIESLIQEYELQVNDLPHGMYFIKYNLKIYPFIIFR